MSGGREPDSRKKSEEEEGPDDYPFTPSTLDPQPSALREAADFWLREAMGPLEELLALEAAEGEAAARARLEVLRQAYLGLRESWEDRPLVELDAGGRIDRQIARSRGAWVLWMLRSSLGVLDFRDLQRAWASGEAGTTAALREWLLRQGGATNDERPTTNETGTERSSFAVRRSSHWEAFFDFWIYGTGLPQYELLTATARPAGQGYSVTARAANRGAGSISAPAVIQTEEGARHTFWVSAPAAETVEATYFVLTRPVQAAIDPDGELLQPDRATIWRPVRVRRWWIF